MGNSLCLVDGTFELFRAFFGAPSRKTPEGAEIAATLSLCRSMMKLRSQGEFSHFAIAFDTEIESFRNQLFTGYKTGDGIDPELFSQFGPVEEGCRALGFEVLSMREFEADDGLAALSHRFLGSPELEQIVIASPDKDLTQMVVGTRVVTWDRIRDRRYDEAGVVERMGVSPASVPDYLALVGDTADGIPGIPRWGARSTSAVLCRYPHLEDIPSDVADWDLKVRGGATLAQNLSAARESAFLYRTLATLRTDVPLELSLADLVPRPPNAELCQALAAAWGDEKFGGGGMPSQRP